MPYAPTKTEATGIQYNTIYTPLGNTSNYNFIADLHTSQITTTPAKAFPSLLCLHQPYPDNGS
jgi:hypothetical protein